MNPKKILASLCIVCSAAFSQAQVKVLVNPGDLGEQSRFAISSALKRVVEAAFRQDKVPTFTTMSYDSFADLSATRTRLPDVIVAPAHVIGSALRYGYTPVLGLSKPLQAVLVASADGDITDLAKAQGKRIGVTPEDSVLHYLLRGELQASGTTIKRHFARSYATKYQEALLECMHMRMCDVVWVDEAVFDKWKAAGERLRAVARSKPVPGVSVAIKDGVSPGPEALRNSLMSNLSSVPASFATQVGTIGSKEFEYVSTLGYFTPRNLTGATLVDAREAQRLLKGGAIYIDTRNDAEFQAGHVPGAKLVPYVEKSSKDVDFDPSQDQFDVSQLPPDKNSQLVLGCNGPECWKSFKAGTAALKAGYKKIAWFRGGYPEWRSSVMQVADAR